MVKTQSFQEIHIASGFGIKEILEFNKTGIIGSTWNFPIWFPFHILRPDLKLVNATESNPHKNAVLLIINLSNDIWYWIKEKLHQYGRRILIQMEGNIGWEVAYENCKQFDVFINFDKTYAWHTGYVPINLPYDATKASSHLDKRETKELINASKIAILKDVFNNIFPRKNKAVLIATLHSGNNYLLRYTIAKKYAELVDVYGGGWPMNMPNYKGKCVSKINILKRYRFSLVFENQQQPGYITEKILDCFAAGTVPIYWGAQDIAEYIPDKTYVLAEQFFTDGLLLSNTDYKIIFKEIKKYKDEIFSTFSVRKFISELEQELKKI